MKSLQYTFTKAPVTALNMLLLTISLKQCVLSMLLLPLDIILVVQSTLELRMSIFGSSDRGYTVFSRTPVGIRLAKVRIR